MKIPVLIPIVAALVCAATSPAQESEKPRAEAREKMEKVKQRIQELHAAGQHDEAVRMEQRIREEAGRQGEQPERMRHIAEAIKHLRAAGLNEPAERIEQMMREQQQKPEGREREHAAPKEGGEPMQRAMRETQEQVQKSLREMHEHVQNQLSETHEQMAKMSHAIDELRQQVAKRKDHD